MDVSQDTLRAAVSVGRVTLGDILDQLEPGTKGPLRVRCTQERAAFVAPLKDNRDGRKAQGS